MLHNASEKLSVWAKVILFAGIALSIVAGFCIIWYGAQRSSFDYTYYHMGTVYRTWPANTLMPILGGFLVMIVGSLLSWLNALLLQAFSNLTDDARAIRRHLEWAPYTTRTESPVQAAASPLEAKPTEPAQTEPAQPDPAEAPPESPAET